MNGSFSNGIALRSKYYLLICKALRTVALSHRYDRTFAQYKTLLERANSILRENDSICGDAARLFDKKSGELKPQARGIIEECPAIKQTLCRMSELYRELLAIAPETWFDELSKSLLVAAPIAEYSAAERKLKSFFGEAEGSRIIYEEKKRALSLEYELGISFFADDIKKYEATLKISSLDFVGELAFAECDCFAEGKITLVAAGGERVAFEKSAVLYIGSALYIELELLEDSKAPAFNYYEITKISHGYHFERVIDPQTVEILDKKRDTLT